MKKLFLILLISVTYIILSCDEEMNYYYVVNNSYDEIIEVEFETYDIPLKKINLEKGDKDTIYSYSIIEGTDIYERAIIFTYLKISANSIESKLDYKSNDVWEYTETSDNDAVYYLNVDNTRFE